jgi:phage tail tape-measure protein
MSATTNETVDFTPSDSELEELESLRREAARDLEEVLQERWPVGSEIHVMLSRRQVIPSAAEVIGHSGEQGAVRVRLKRANRRGKRHAPDVHWRRCL